MVRILINGIEPENEPLELGKLSERYYFSDEFWGYLYEITGSLTFYGNDFTNFYNLFSLGDCNKVDIEIQQKGEIGNWNVIFIGIILVRDIVFNIQERTAVCEIIDDSFISKLINYSDTPIDLLRERSRNGEDISITGTLISVDDLDNNVIPTITGYKIIDILNNIVGFITDKNITVVSNFLSTGVADKYWIVTGPNLRYSVDPIVQVKFKEVLTDILKIWNLRWAIINTPSGYEMIIEPAAYFEQGGVIQIDGLKDFEVKTNEKWNYSSFTFGSYNAMITQTTGTPSYILSALKTPWAAHSDSTIIPDGDCAEKRNLDLRTLQICFDANTISYVLNNTSDTLYDTSLFYVCDTVDSLNTTNPDVRIVNPDLFVKYQLNRWLSTYCFPYPGSISACDSYIEADGTYDIVGGPSLIEFQIFDQVGCIYDNIFEPNTGLVNIEMKLILQNPAIIPNPTGLARLYFGDIFNVNRQFIAEDLANGWVNGTPSPLSPYYKSIDRAFVNGEIFEYFGIMNDILITNWQVTPFIDLGFGGIGALTLLPGSYIKVTSGISTNDFGTCDIKAFSVSANGYILPTKAKDIRNGRFGNVLLPNDFRNYSGNILEIERSITENETKITINTKTI
jgi:hypothetical protein